MNALLQAGEAQKENAQQPMKTATVKKATGPVDLAKGPELDLWKKAEVIPSDVFKWHKEGQKHATSVRLLYDDTAIYLLFVCDDTHISSQTTELNGNVCLDSCVEFFATINPEKGPHYFNFEANCCGMIHLGWGPDRNNRKLIAPELAKGIQVATSVPGPTKEESADDKGWWLAAAIPFSVIAEHSGEKVEPKAGTVWRCNFYRCGGKTNQQYITWNPVASPTPDFHRPDSFGTLKFE